MLTTGCYVVHVKKAFQFTPGQLRRVASIAPETYRHWKKTLAPLRRHRGHSPCFTSGDLVAIAVVRALCIDLGVRVGALSRLADALFTLCNDSPWPVLERGKLVFDFSSGQLELQPVTNAIEGGMLVIVPLRLIIGPLRDQLLAGREPDDQQALRFPPTAVSSALRSSRRGRP